jgi:hypothetical protein
MPPDDQPAAPAEGRSPFAEQLCVPQFGILHILLLTAVMAALLKLQLAVEQPPSPSVAASPVLLWLWKALVATGSAVVAAGVIGTGVLVRTRCYRMLGRLQPGHWIVLVGTLGSLLGLVVWSIYEAWSASAHLDADAASSGSYWVHLVFTALTYPLFAAALAYAAIRLRDGGRWKLLFGAIVLGEVTSAIGATIAILLTLVSGRYASYSLSWAMYNGSALWSALLLFVVLIAAAIDLLRRVPRDWVHWLGVATLLTHYLATLGWWIANYLIPPKL